MALYELVTPGEILFDEFLEPMGISQNQMARDLDVSTTTINDIVHCRRAITANMALRLGKFFGMEAEFWMALQSDYELRKEKRAMWKAIDLKIRPYSSSPLKKRKISLRTKVQPSESKALKSA